MNKWLKRLLKTVVILAMSWIVTGLVLSVTPPPSFKATPKPTKANPPVSCGNSPEVMCLTMRDGVVLKARQHHGSALRTVVLVHGIFSDSSEMEVAATALNREIGATVLNVDLRGHGRSGGQQFDIDHIGQYEEDLADVVKALRAARPDQQIVLAGHSMGGGVVLRYAERKLVPVVDAYLLLAPNLGYDAPTTRKSSPESSTAKKSAATDVSAPRDAPIKLHLKRTVGLMMLNAFGFHGLDGLGTLYVNAQRDGELLGYSYRAMRTTSPDDYQLSLAADSRPMLIVVGDKDEAFDSAEYPAVARLHTNATVEIIAGAGHDTLLTNPRMVATAKQWLQ